MGRWKLVGALGCALATALAQPAAGIERVRDGGFDAARCTPADCVSSAWTESSAGTSPIGPICDADTVSCADRSGTGYNTGPNWARLGAGVAATTAVAQTVPIPAAPAKLVFLLHITTSANGNDTLTVTIDGTEVFRATDATPGYAVYKRVEIDARAFAGGAHVLRFQGRNNAVTTPSDSFDVDEVSLDAVEPPPLPPPVSPSADADGDKYLSRLVGGPDCDDTNAAVHPGATDIPHDGVDQDCARGDAPYPKLSSRPPGIAVAYSPRGSKPYTMVTSLKPHGVPVGATVTLSCSPKHKGCPFRRKSFKVRSKKPLQLAKYFKNAQLKKNAVLTVRVTKPGYIGRFFRYRIRINALPRKTKRCLEPGQTTPRKTCS